MIKKTPINYKVAIYFSIIILVAALIWISLRFSVNYEETYNSSARIQAASYFELSANGQPVLQFDRDTTMYAACWTDGWALIPSCHGQLIAYINDRKVRDRYASMPGETFVGRCIDSLDTRCKHLEHILGELKYYARVHNPQDEGYEMVMKYYDMQQKLHDSIHRQLDTLRAIRHKNKLSIKYHTNYRVVYDDNYNHEISMNCFVRKHIEDDYYLMQTSNKTKPQGVMSQPERLAKRIVCNMARSVRREIDFSLRPDSDGLYWGCYNSEFLPDGHGCYLANNGDFYEGHWKNGLRDGFGFSISRHKGLRTGEWKKDTFKGERMLYSSERIYGIDISKYQHIIGKEHWAIDWAILRISSLGSISKKRVKGSVDYPIRFIYIKSTEGTSVMNPYYHKDYRNARAHGYRVGTYHFFSTRSSGRQQAAFFIKKSNLRRGDFPPVLDVEPSNAQIREMGGDGVLFAHIRQWLDIVERHCGVKPILYISQSFVNHHLDKAPDLKHNYRVWIARYGEYKPDVRLAVWQLCPDGRVRGIKSSVDINVFNGFESEYQNFLRWQLIR